CRGPRRRSPPRTRDRAAGAGAPAAASRALGPLPLDRRARRPLPPDRRARRRPLLLPPAPRRVTPHRALASFTVRSWAGSTCDKSAGSQTLATRTLGRRCVDVTCERPCGVFLRRVPAAHPPDLRVPEHGRSVPRMAATGAGLLKQLDSRDLGPSYLYLALLATIGACLLGFVPSHIGSPLALLPFDLCPVPTGVIVSAAPLGSFVGALAAGPLTGRFGRKSILFVDSGLFAVGALISAAAVGPVSLTVGRVIIGLAVGADSAMATAYISEFAPKSRRGSLGIIQQWMITIGILAAYIVAVIILVIAPGAATTVDWRILLGVGFIPAVISLLLRARMPESPRWL